MKHFKHELLLQKHIILIPFLFILCCCGKPTQPLNFPFDHGPHFDSVNEWWYFTGEVTATGGKTLGFELTIFKRLAPTGKDFAYLGHIAVSDPYTKTHLFAEVPTSPPVIGVEEGKTEVVVNNFSYRFSESEGIAIKADTETLQVDLTLTPLFNVLPHGEDGAIVMGDGIPSYYYSFTNLDTEGALSVNGVEYTIISGRTWMDHQWGNFTVLGMLWDWFSLRFEDGGSLMLFQFRNMLDCVTKTTWTYQSGSGAVTYGEDFSMQATRIYREAEGQGVYPVDWIIEVPELDAEFQVTPLFDAQSLYDVMTPDYWEGLCSVEGTLEGKPVSGAAYVELTGYETRSTGK